MLLSRSGLTSTGIQSEAHSITREEDSSPANKNEQGPNKIIFEAKARKDLIKAIVNPDHGSSQEGIYEKQSDLLVKSGDFLSSVKENDISATKMSFFSQSPASGNFRASYCTQPSVFLEKRKTR